MDRRKVALLIALSVLLIFLAIGTAVTAWDVLGGRYEVAGDGVSLVMLLAFLTYADAELVLLLRAKFEDDLKNSEARKVVLVYLIMFLLLVLIGILYFGSAQDKESESLGDEHAISSIPPEVEEEALLPQIIIEESSGELSLSVETEEECTSLEEEESISTEKEDVEVETEVSEQEEESAISSIPPETEDGMSLPQIIKEESSEESSLSVESEEEYTPSEEDVIITPPQETEMIEQEESISTENEEVEMETEVSEQVEEARTEDSESSATDEDESMVMEEIVKEDDMIKTPSAPEILYLIPRLYEVVPPPSPIVSVSSSSIREIPVPSSPTIGISSSSLRDIPVPTVPDLSVSASLTEQSAEDKALEDFWASFYIAGEDELTLSDGIYYMGLYVNDSYTGTITVLVENEELSLLSSELRTYVGDTVTDEFEERMFSEGGEYVTLSYLERLGVQTSYDAISYEMRLNFSPEDMPIQILSIGGTSAFRRSSRPISGGMDLSPAVFTLTSSYYFNARVRNFLDRDIVNGLSFSFSSSNTARLYDLYLDFNYYMNFTPNSFRFNIGSYRFRYDFPDSLIRLSFGNVSSDLFSPAGTSIGIRFDRSYAYAPSGYRRPSQIEELIVVDKPSEIQIFNEGREIYRRTLDVGTYRLRDFILYTGANRITIVLTPLDGSEVKTIDMDVLYSASLLAPGEIYYGASLVTGRRIVSSDTSYLDGAFRIPVGGGRSLEYDLRDVVLSSYVRAGLTPTLSLDSTIAFQNDPTALAAFRPNMKLALEFTHANVLGTTRYGLNITERTEDDASWNIPGIYANIGHQIRTDLTWLSSISLGANYSSPEELRVDGRHRIGLNTSLSGRLGIVNWSLSASGGIYTDEISNSYWSTSASLSLSASRNVWLSASMSASGSADQNPSIYGRVYATIRYDNGSVNTSVSNRDASISTRYGTGRHSFYAGIDTNSFTNFDDYSFEADYGYAGDFIDLDLGLNADNSFLRVGASLSLRTASVFADGLFAFRSYIPSNYVLISQSGALKGNSVSIGSAGYSMMSELPSSFGISLYDGLPSSSADSFIVYSQGDDSFSATESFPVNIPSSTRRGYVLRLSAENTYAASAIVTLPDGLPWINGSSPIYKVVEDKNGTLLERTDEYLFTDGNGRFVTAAMEPGEYAFDVPYDGAWILVRFTIDDRVDDLGLLQILAQGEIVEAEIMPETYTYETEMTYSSVMSQDAFFEMLYGMEVAA